MDIRVSSSNWLGDFVADFIHQSLEGVALFLQAPVQGAAGQCKELRHLLQRTPASDQQGAQRAAQPAGQIVAVQIFERGDLLFEPPVPVGIGPVTGWSSHFAGNTSAVCSMSNLNATRKNRR
jgi:hypothetical protein